MQDNPVIDRYVNWLETLGKTGTHRVSQFVARDVRHRTPEADAVGPEGSAALAAELFEGVAELRTKVLARMPGPDGHTVYLRWDRLVTPTHGARWSLSGITELTVGMDGKIISIIEYWDGTPPATAPQGIIARLLKRQRG